MINIIYIHEGDGKLPLLHESIIKIAHGSYYEQQYHLAVMKEHEVPKIK